MLNSETKRHIDKARDVLVGVAPSPMTQVDLITTALIYKFMDDMDQQSIKLGGKPSFFVGDIEKYSWNKLMDPKLDNQGKVNLYQEALTKLPEASNLPTLFREIFKDTYLPFRNVNTFKLFIDEIDYFDYSHPEELGNAFEYLLTILGVSGDAGMFRTPRHIIDFIVKVVDPNKDDRILDPACGTAGFLIQAYKHIISKHDGLNDPEGKEEPLTTEEIKNLTNNIEGYDISPEMVKLSSVNLYLHDFKNPKISEYDTLSSDEKWNERFDVILANPPFMTPRGGIIPHNRFSIQATKSEVLFVDYILTHLKHNGRAGIVVPEGIIFQSGNAYKELRKKLLNEGLFGVVSLPSGVFNPYSGVKTSILLIDKELAKSKDEVLFIKISNDGFDLGAQRREINKNDLPEALEIINKWKNGEKVESKLSNHVSKKLILENKDLNLTVERYLEKTETESEFKILNLSDLIEFEKKSVRKSGDGLVAGKFKFFVSSQKQEKYIDKADYIEENLILGTGGNPSVHISSNFSCSADTFVFHSKDQSILLNKYLYYFLKYNIEVLEKGFKGQGIKHLSKEYLLYIKIPVPPIEIQEQIVEELDRYQKIIEGAKLISDNWKPNFEINPKWKIEKLKNIAEYRIGLTYSPNEVSNEGVIVLRSSNIRNNEIILNDIVRVNLKIKEDLFVNDGDILMCARNGSKNLVGKVALLEGLKEPMTFGAFMMVIRSIYNKYLFNFFTTSYFRDQLKVGETSSINQVTKSMLDNINVPFPDVNEQILINQRVDNEKQVVVNSTQLIKIYEHKSKEKIDSLWKRD